MSIKIKKNDSLETQISDLEVNDNNKYIASYESKYMRFIYQWWFKFVNIMCSIGLLPCACGITYLVSLYIKLPKMKVGFVSQVHYLFFNDQLFQNVSCITIVCILVFLFFLSIRMTLDDIVDE